MRTEVSSVPDNPALPPKKRKSGVVIPHKPRWNQRLAAALIYVIVRCVEATVRYKGDVRSGFFSGAPK